MANKRLIETHRRLSGHEQLCRWAGKIVGVRNTRDRSTCCVNRCAYSSWLTAVGGAKLRMGFDPQCRHLKSADRARGLGKSKCRAVASDQCPDLPTSHQFVRTVASAKMGSDLPLGPLQHSLEFDRDAYRRRPRPVVHRESWRRNAASPNRPFAATAKSCGGRTHSLRVNSAV